MPELCSRGSIATSTNLNGIALASTEAFGSRSSVLYVTACVDGVTQQCFGGHGSGRITRATCNGKSGEILTNGSIRLETASGTPLKPGSQYWRWTLTLE